MKVEVGNRFYFMYLGIALAVFVILLLILRKTSKKTARLVLILILFANLALHFLKQTFEPFASHFPNMLTESTLQNICAVSTVVCPFIYLIKKQNILHDYMFFICGCGGLAGLVYPTEAIGEAAFMPNIIRFYFCHASLVIVVVLAAVLGIYRPRLKSFWAVPLLFLAQETIIALNECFLIKVGLLKCDYSRLLDRGFRNQSFAFGLRPDFDWGWPLFKPFVPKFLTTDAFHINGGKPFYFPVLWMTIPAIVYLIPLYVIVSSPFWIYDLIKRKKHPKLAK